MDVLHELNTALAGRYVIDREIGAGGMATVYLAEDLRHHRKVALKVLKPELAAVLGTERFLAEIDVTANLQHPHLLPLFDSGEASGALYYVMPFIAGETLRQRLERERQLPVDDAVRIAVAAASALDYAHRHGVVHRDLKPENVLLHDGQPLVSDFGIALAVSNAGGARITQTGLSLGTPQYMSPEQATGDRVIDARSDIYSLSAVLYEMLTGEPPHTGSTVQQIVARVLTEKPRSLRAMRDTVPAHVDAAVMCALAKLPADRFPSAHEFAEALSGNRRVNAGTSATALTERAPARDRWRKLAPWSLAALALILAGALAVWPDPRVAARVKLLEITLADSIHPVGENAGVDVSRDGTKIAFVAHSGQQRAIFIRPFASMTTSRIAGTEGGWSPRFSRDGQWIAFRQNTQLRKVPVSGGVAVTLADSVSGSGDAQWTESGEIIFPRAGGIWRMSA
ncbi:MAG: protein kinase domain-containing protein, partial [Gemmatimonadota bacterium]